MKKLSEVTLEDAKKILENSYLCWRSCTSWIIEDEEISGEKCKHITSDKNIYGFWFFNDSIDVESEDAEIPTPLVGTYDVKYQCYIEAVKLGYYVPELTEFVEKINA